jgi:hypothetical protein
MAGWTLRNSSLWPASRARTASPVP